MHADEDPGWRLRPLTVLQFLPPFGIWLRHRRLRESRGDGLLLLRELFLSFCTALIMFGLVLVFLDEEPTDGLSPTWFAIGIAVAGVVSLVAVDLLERPFDCSTDQSLAEGYRTRFFLRIAFAEVVALLGFVGVFTAGAL